MFLELVTVNRSIFRNATVVSVTFLLPQKSAHFWTVMLRCRAIPPLQYKDIAQFTDPIFARLQRSQLQIMMQSRRCCSSGLARTPKLCLKSYENFNLLRRFLVFKRHNPLACPTSVCNSQITPADYNLFIS